MPLDDRKSRIRERTAILFSMGQDRQAAAKLAESQIDREDRAHERANINRTPQRGMDQLFRWKVTPDPENMKRDSS